MNIGNYYKICVNMELRLYTLKIMRRISLSLLFFLQIFLGTHGFGRVERIQTEENCWDNIMPFMSSTFGW